MLEVGFGQFLKSRNNRSKGFSDGLRTRMRMCRLLTPPNRGLTGGLWPPAAQYVRSTNRLSMQCLWYMARLAAIQSNIR